MNVLALADVVSVALLERHWPAPPPLVRPLADIYRRIEDAHRFTAAVVATRQLSYGLASAAHLRHQAELAAVPVVILTTWDPDNLSNLKAAVVDEVLPLSDWGISRCAEMVTSLQDAAHLHRGGDQDRASAGDLIGAQDQLTDSLSDTELAQVAGLTIRQASVARRLALRLTDREIADQLGLKTSTIRRYTEAVLIRLGVHSRRDVSAALAVLRRHRSPTPSAKPG